MTWWQGRPPPRWIAAFNFHLSTESLVTPAKLQSLLQSALAHHRAGRLVEAEGLYRQARAAAPKSFDAVHLSGLLAYQQGRLPEAAELLWRAHAMDRRNAACEMRLALAL